jgi:hypothetical protein
VAGANGFRSLQRHALPVYYQPGPLHFCFLAVQLHRFFLRQRLGKEIGHALGSRQVLFDGYWKVVVRHVSPPPKEELISKQVLRASLNAIISLMAGHNSHNCLILWLPPSKPPFHRNSIVKL